MQAKKEIAVGRFYMQSMYSAGMLPGLRPAARRARMRKQSEHKRKINKMERLYKLIQLFEMNFRPGRDLFVELSFRAEPNRAEERRALERFNRRMAREFQALGREYRYILVRETHNRDGQPVRQHYHLICTGTGRRMLDRICSCWDAGTADVRTLRDAMNSFEDTCRYLLKERKEANERAYRTSRNLKRPPEPLRRKAPESATGEVPPGVEPVRVEIDCSNPYGRCSIIVGVIVDQAAFGRYWAKAQLDKRHAEEAANWRRYARQRRREKQAI